MEPNLRNEYNNLGASPADGKSLVKMAMDGIAPNELRTKTRQTERKACDHCLKATQLLDKTWGEWRVEGGEILFTDADNTRLYNGLADLIVGELLKIRRSRQPSRGR